MTSRTASESSFSPIAVEPFKSEQTIVTVFRTSCAGSWGASADPQNPQRRNLSGFSSPQFGQICTKQVYGHPVANSTGLRSKWVQKGQAPRDACPKTPTWSYSSA